MASRYRGGGGSVPKRLLYHFWKLHRTNSAGLAKHSLKRDVVVNTSEIVCNLPHVSGLEGRTINSMDNAVDRMNPRTIKQSYRREFML
jgi:hypothetical protein